MLTSGQFRRHEVNSLCYFLVFPETQTGHKVKRMHLQTRSHSIGISINFQILPKKSKHRTVYRRDVYLYVHFTDVTCNGYLKGGLRTDLLQAWGPVEFYGLKMYLETLH